MTAELTAAPTRPVHGSGRSLVRLVGRSLPLAAIILLALLLRLPGAAWQLPWHFHPDEGHYVWKAVEMQRDGNLNPKYFRNPSLFTYLLLVQFQLLGPLGLPAQHATASELLQSPSFHTLIGRLTSVLLGVGTVAATYRLGLEVAGRAAGLLGALLLAVCFLHVRDSQFATNDVPATFFLTLSVFFSLVLLRSRRTTHLLLAALFGGLATSAKYNAGLFLVPLGVSFLLAYQRRALTKRRLAELPLVGLVAGLAYLAGTPFTLLAWPSFRDDFLVQQRFAREGWEGQGPEPVGLLYLETVGQGLGWAGLGLALVGMVLLARRRPGAAALLAAYPVAYIAFMLGVKLFFARFAIPLLPFLAVAAACGLVELTRLARPGRARTGLLVALTAVALLQPFWNDLLHREIMAQSDTRTLAYAWLDQNLPASARIIADDYSVRDRRPRSDLPDRTRFDLDQVNAVGERSLDSLQQQGYRYVVTSSFQQQRFPGRFGTYAALDQQARLLAVFTPTRHDLELPFDIEELYSPFHDLARYQRPGPTIKIYELPLQ